jgi:hypothetical protein
MDPRVATPRRSSAVSTPRLPPELQAVKQRILELTSANTLRTDNVDEVRKELDPLVNKLEDWFAANRPADEPARTRGTWKSVWFDADQIARDRGPIRLDRAQIYQVVEDGYYYNLSDTPLRAGPLKLGTVHAFLKGNYELKDPATPANRGEKRLNVIDLEFDANKVRLGKIPEGRDLRALVDDVEKGEAWSVPVPGPRGIRGELWNAYVDDDLRISRGVQDDIPGVVDLYVLRRVKTRED